MGSVFGKAYHRYIRARIIDRTESVLRDTHFGVRRGSTVVQASHIAVLYEAAQRNKRRSSALLFVDAKSAYYCVIRQMVYGASSGHEDAVIMRIMQHFGLPEAAWEELLRVIEDGGLFQQHGFSEHVRQLTKDLHDASFFVTRNSTGSTVVETQLGSRPGESIADIIFAWILHRVLDCIDFKMRDAGCTEFVLSGDERNLWDTGGDAQVLILGPIWADDGAFMTPHQEADVLWTRAKQLAATVLRCFFESGLTPNLAKGKTEMLLTFRGCRSQKMQAALFGGGQQRMVLHIPGWGEQSLRLTTEYVHLGCALDRGATMTLESSRRLLKANGSFQEHRKRIYQNVSIPVSVRGVLFAAMVESTMFNLEIWNCMRGQAWARLKAGHSRLLKRLLAKDVPAETLLSLRLSDMVRLAQHPTIDIIARGKRLRYMITVARAAPPVLWALFHFEEQWQAQCREDFEWLCAHDAKEWPPFAEATWPQWWHVLRDTPEAFRRAIGRATRASTAVFALQGVFDRITDAMHRDAYRFCPQAYRVDGVEVWVCGPCRKVFAKKSHLACHLFKTHHRQAEFRFYLTGAVCVACSKDFQTEDRLQRHLSHSAACWLKVSEMGSTCSVAGPGIGSKEWRQQRRDFPILHPPLPADVVLTDAGGRSSGETPGATLIRKCVGELGVFVANLPLRLTLDGFICRCVEILLGYPFYPSEMKAAIDEAIADLVLCVEEELLDWDIDAFVRVKTWLQHCSSCLHGRWLCEWAQLSTGTDSGPCKLLRTGCQLILAQRGSIPELRCVFLVGDAAADVEMTHRLGSGVQRKTLRWCELLDGFHDFRGSLLAASLLIPGEAVAGGSKSTTALDANETRGLFTLACTVSDFEPHFRALWRAYLGGARVQLRLMGSVACGTVAEKLSLFLSFGWLLSSQGDRCVCLLSDGPGPSAACVSPAN